MELELAEHACDVVLHRFAADEQALGDVGVRQALTEQFESRPDLFR